VPPGFTTGIEILNDNHTTMEFVVSALNTHLRMPQEEAIAAMLDIHAKGGLLISLPTYEKAISVATAITSDAIANGFSLICRPVVVQQN
jgi:ATP-dependent Clp protease adapter protein ClpS